MNELEILSEVIEPYLDLDLNKEFNTKIWKEIYDSISKYELDPKLDPPILDLEDGFYDNILESDRVGVSSGRRAAYVDIQDNFKDTILENVSFFEIKSYYVTIIKRLLESDILSIERLPNFKNVFITIFNNYHIFKWGVAMGPHGVESNEDDLKKYNILRTWLNYTYGILYSHKNSYKPSGDITYYTRKILEEISNDINWVYIDTDQIFFYSNGDYHNLINKYKDKYGIESNIKDIDFLYYKSKKKYILSDEMGIHTKGIKRRGSTPEDVENVIREISARQREKIIDTLL